MSKSLKICSVFLVSFGIALLTMPSSSGVDFPYLSDELLERFSVWADGRVVPFQIEATIYDRDTGLSRDVRGYCTAPLISATDKFIYGLVADHCVQSDFEKTVRGLYALNSPVRLLSYHRPPNEVRIWAVNNAERIPPGEITPIAQRAWWPGVQVFVVGVQRMKHGSDDRTKDVFDKWYTRGSVQTAQRGFDLDGAGDLNHSAPVTFGFSGGPAFVYNTRTNQFELLAINNALEIVSLFSYSYSIDREAIIQAIKQDATTAPEKTPSPPPQSDQKKRHFSNWELLPKELQEQWDAWYDANAPYTLDPFEAVIVESHRVGIGPEKAVIQAWLNNRLPVVGRLQDVDWSEFEYTEGS